MPNSSYSSALQEVLALAPTDEVVLNCLEISHTDLTESLHIVQDNVEHEITLEDASIVKVEPVPFEFTLPSSSEEGTQSLSVSVDNIDGQVTDFLDQITSASPVELTLRIYLSSDLTTPQLSPPLKLYLTDFRVNAITVTGRATFSDLINSAAFRDNYDRETFPGLRG